MLLKLIDKHLVKSSELITTTSNTYVDDPYSELRFSLPSSKYVLIIYQGNCKYGDPQNHYGSKVALEVDGEIKVESSDSCRIYNNYAIESFIFWFGLLGSGEHIVKGKIRSLYSGDSTSISNRVMMVLVFDGDEGYYLYNTTLAQTDSDTLVDDPYASITITPSSDCLMLVLYSVSNDEETEREAKKIGININGDRITVERCAGTLSNYPTNITAIYALDATNIEYTIKGRFCSKQSGYTVSIARRSLCVLLLDKTKLIYDVVHNTTSFSTTSGEFVDDPYAVIERVLTDNRILFVLATATKYKNVSSDDETCYGININGSDVTETRCSTYGNQSFAYALAYITDVSSGYNYVKGRVKSYIDDAVSVISERYLVALWFEIPTPAPTYIDVNVNIPIQSGETKSGIYEQPSLFTMRYTPSTLVDAHHFGLRLEDTEIYPDIKIEQITGEFRQYDSSNVMVKRNLFEINRGYEDQFIIESGFAYAEIVITNWKLNFALDKTFNVDSVYDGTLNCILRLKLQREDNTVIEGVNLYANKIISTAKFLEGITNTTREFFVKREYTSEYIARWLFKIVEIDGTPDNDKVKLELYYDNEKLYDFEWLLKNITIPFSFSIGGGINFNRVVITPSLTNVNKIKVLFDEYIKAVV